MAPIKKTSDILVIIKKSTWYRKELLWEKAGVKKGIILQAATPLALETETSRVAWRGGGANAGETFQWKKF